MRTVTARDDLPEFKHTACWQLIPGVVLVASWNDDDALVTYNLPVVDATLFPFELGAVRREQRLALTYGQA